MLASLILTVHFAIIAFNLFGLVAIPLGGWRNWAFVRRPVWRLLHVGSLAAVAGQAAFGRACFLTIWHDDLTGAGLTEAGDSGAPLIMQWVNDAIHWPLPMWVFAAVYGLIFAWTLALLWLVPLRR